jgi:hypothetical protein
MEMTQTSLWSVVPLANDPLNSRARLARSVSANSETYVQCPPIPPAILILIAAHDD